MKTYRKPKDWKQERGKEAEWNRVVRSASDDDAPRTAAQKAALARLGVTEEQLNAAPKITPLLKMAAGGLKQIVDAMRFAPDAVIASFLRKYDTISARQRASLSWEAIALSAGIPVSALLGSILCSLQLQSTSAIKMICLTHHPAITRARFKYGQLPGGHQDRQACDQILGLLPNPKGPTFIGKAIFGSGESAMRQQRRLRAGDEGPDDDDDFPLDPDEVPLAAQSVDLDTLFPSARETQEELIPIRNRLLGDSQPDPDSQSLFHRSGKIKPIN